jgi:hypothetical protein
MDPDPDPRGPKTYGSDGSGFGSAALAGSTGFGSAANPERILALTLFKRNRFWHTLSQLGNILNSNISAKSNSFFKNLVLQALGAMKIKILKNNGERYLMLVYL